MSLARVGGLHGLFENYTGYLRVSLSKLMFRKLVDYLSIKRSGAFDSAYYLLKYSDCRRADIDPLWHFVDWGWKEGRNPSSEFDTEYYLRTNPDVKQIGINPLVHYLKHGRYEGRAAQPAHPRHTGFS